MNWTKYLALGTVGVIGCFASTSCDDDDYYPFVDPEIVTGSWICTDVEVESIYNEYNGGYYPGYVYDQIENDLEAQYEGQVFNLNPGTISIDGNYLYFNDGSVWQVIDFEYDEMEVIFYLQNYNYYDGPMTIEVRADFDRIGGYY